MTLEEMLENRHTTLLEWGEPWPATGPEGNDLSAHITLRATVHDCVNLRRHIAMLHGDPTMGNDDGFLADFIAVHWAAPIQK